MKKIVFTYVDEEKGYQDSVSREIPITDSYNFCKGMLIDLYLLMERNSLIPAWLRKQFKNMNLLSS